MKNHILILFLSLSFLISNSQSKDGNKQESYILTKEGEKIKIAAGFDIFYTRFNIDYTTKSTPYGKKKKEKNIGYLQRYYQKTKLIKPKLIEKIVDGDRLYLPFIDDDKVKIFRYIAKNSKYILGTYITRYTSGKTNVFIWNYVIFDHDYNLIKQGKVYHPESIRKSKNKMDELKKSIAVIKEYFGECLGRNDDLFDIVKLNGFEANENFLLKDFSLEKLSNKDYKNYYSKHRMYFRLKFLHYQTQIQCD